MPENRYFNQKGPGGCLNGGCFTGFYVTEPFFIDFPQITWYINFGSFIMKMIDYRSHVTMLGQPDKKGKSRYCCVTCGHQFTCSGRRRIIQHIIGRDYCLGYERDILACPNPNLPLKASLLLQYRKKGSKQKHCLIASAILDEGLVRTSNPDFFSVSASSSRSSSYCSAASVSSVCSDSFFVKTKDAVEIQVDRKEDLPVPYFNSNSVKQEDIRGIPSYPESASCLYPAKFSSSTENCNSVSPLKLNALIPSSTISTNQQSTIQLEQAISKFFSIYNIPDSAKHDPSFQQLFAIQTATDASNILFEMMNKKTSFT
jgi:hypothetical protein